MLWAAFHAFGAHVDLSVILLGYLVGQLGGLLPIPGGVGGIDGGLFGMLLAFGAPATATAAAVLAYRVILFWIPLIGGAIGFVALRRSLAGTARRRDVRVPRPVPRAELATQPAVVRVPRPAPRAELAAQPAVVRVPRPAPRAEPAAQATAPPAPEPEPRLLAERICVRC